MTHLRYLRASCSVEEEQPTRGRECRLKRAGPSVPPPKGPQGTAHFDLHSFPLVGCSSSLEQDALCRIQRKTLCEGGTANQRQNMRQIHLYATYFCVQIPNPIFRPLFLHTPSHPNGNASEINRRICAARTNPLYKNGGL